MPHKPQKLPKHQKPKQIIISRNVRFAFLSHTPFPVPTLRIWNQQVSGSTNHTFNITLSFCLHLPLVLVFLFLCQACVPNNGNSTFLKTMRAWISILKAEVLLEADTESIKNIRYQILDTYKYYDLGLDSLLVTAALTVANLSLLVHQVMLQSLNLTLGFWLLQLILPIGKAKLSRGLNFASCTTIRNQIFPSPRKGTQDRERKTGNIAQERS